jgi:hypothetical protein
MEAPMTRTSVLLLALCACDPKNGDTAAGADDFTAGSFVFTSTAVQDGCLDGAFETLFLPEGTGTTSDWQYPVELPAWADLPATYTVQLQEPFGDVEVTVTEGGAGAMRVDGASLVGVEFDADNYPGCLVDMGVGVDIVIDSADAVHGTATMNTSNVTGDSCPVFAADPCDLVLDFTGARQ